MSPFIFISLITKTVYSGISIEISRLNCIVIIWSTKNPIIFCFLIFIFTFLIKRIKTLSLRIKVLFWLRLSKTPLSLITIPEKINLMRYESWITRYFVLIFEFLYTCLTNSSIFSWLEYFFFVLIVWQSWENGRRQKALPLNIHGIRFQICQEKMKIQKSWFNMPQLHFWSTVLCLYLSKFRTRFAACDIWKPRHAYFFWLSNV